MKREQVKKVALKMVGKKGLINLSRRELCEKAGIPDGSFPHVMGCSFTEFVDELKITSVKEPFYVVSKTRANPELRKDHILNVAVKMAVAGGYNKITRDKVAEGAGVSMGLVTKYFGTMPQLRKAIMRRAVKQEIIEIVAQGIANGDPQAKKASSELKTQAVALLVKM